MNTRRPRMRVRLLHVAALSALALAHALFETLTVNPLFLIVRRTGAAELWVFVSAAVLVPAALLAGLECATERLSRRVGWACHLALVGGLSALLLSPVFNLLGSVTSVAGPIATAIAVAYGYARIPAVASAMTWLSPALVIVPAVFLARSPVAPWTWRGIAPPAEAAPAPLHQDAGVRDVSVAMLVFDELPLVTLLNEAGRVDGVRYPNFASLQRNALWMRNATADGSHTHTALPALVSGRLPPANRRYDARRAPTLFEMLSRTHAITASEPLLKLCPDPICKDGDAAPAWRRVGAMLQDAAVVQAWLLAPRPLRPELATRFALVGGYGVAGIERAHGDDTSETSGSRDPAAVRQQMLAWQRDPSGRPTLHFAHVMLPHQPFVHLPTGQRYRDSDDRVYRPWENEEVALEYHRRHAVQAAYADAVLGVFLDRVRALGVWDEGIVVVAADHGLAFVAGSDPRNADERNVGEVAWVPLFVRAPSAPRGVVYDTPASSVDVVATILDELKTRPSRPLDGRSVLQASAHPRQRRIVNEIGGVLRIDPTLTAMNAALQRKLSHVGAGPFERVFQSGRSKGLMFQRVEELPTAEPANDVVVTITNPSQYDEVGLSGSFLPALVSGTIAASRPVELAVALNGRIAAVRAVERGGVFIPDRTWEALLPWMLLRDGKNELAVFEVDRSSGEARLRTVRRRPDSV